MQAPSKDRKEIVVLVSGSGSNLERIFEAIENQEISNARVSLVVADRECYALERAARRGVRAIVIPRGRNFSSQLDEALPEGVDLIVLAGFLSILSPAFCEKYEGRTINLHPALLPKYGGAGMWGDHVHNAVLRAGEKESGASVHFVSPGIDQGEIILQKAFTIAPEDSLETLKEKVHQIEYEIFPKAIEQVLSKVK